MTAAFIEASLQAAAGVSGWQAKLDAEPAPENLRGA